MSDTKTTSKPWEHAKSSGSETDPLAARFVSSIDYDWRLYKQDIRGSIAHATMLEQVGLITAGDLEAIEAGLRAIESEIDERGRGWPGFTYELEDIHMCVEAALIERVGEPGRKLHTGRSRNDQVALDLMLWVRDAIEERVTPLLDALTDGLVALAERDGAIVMPSYTHLQRAQPIVVGGELFAWHEAFVRAGQRVAQVGVDMYHSPLGSGAVAGTSLPLNRDMTAEALDFPLNASSSIDATANRDAAVDFVYALSMTAMTLSRWAEQWIIYASTEFGFIKLDDAYTTGSSMMPQKQNPDMLELIRGKCGAVYGSLVALLTTLKGLPIAYNRDLQEDKKHVFRAFDDVCDCLEMAAKIVAGTTFQKERIASTLDRGYLDATSLADYLVTKGVPFRTAHQVVGRLVQVSEERGLGALGKLSLEQFRAESELVEADVFDWLGAENVVKRYQSDGNAGLSGFVSLLEWVRSEGAAEGEALEWDDMVSGLRNLADQMEAEHASKPKGAD
ncbi:argininosuccinate lyase [Mucisphaera calidilacus]|uniref:Argininosuccinate lyase n=1 Tax=Mucisphaera calidilacus TaxID=2527982 RepID=A0A518BTA6_9BACT|nr:argininosuccinate lyase [Mucisphaera calidilacus]QDU70185.1 Argininosuccinate lyase [Mucisphaera calidilacus]